MKAIIRNCNHGSDLVVVENLDGAGHCSVVSKSSTTSRGIQALRNELVAYQWYNSRLQKKISISAVEAKHSLHINLEYIQGTKYDYTEGLLRNRKGIEYALRHYCDVWKGLNGANPLVPSHGDFSLENLLFSDSAVTIIDWEHFSVDVLPIGFDGLYLLFVSLFFEIGIFRHPTKKMIYFVAENIALLKEAGCLDRSFEEAPLISIVRCIRGKKEIWNLPEKDFLKKIPILQWTDRRVREIDNALLANGSIWGDQ